jgi:hypothetical protein
MEEKKSIEEQAQATFLKNMAFFQANHPDVFEKLTAFETAISKGYYIPKYALEYKDEGYFDVEEIETGRWLYEVVDSKTYAKMAADNISYKKTENLFETFKQLNFSEEMIQEYSKKNIIETTFATTVKLIDYWDKHFSSTEYHMKRLYKFIFMGTGLGTHLIEIHNKIKSNVYFIIENDLELFYLSLFVTDYTVLKDNNAILIFSIFDEEDVFHEKVSTFLHEMFMYNHYIKFHLFFGHSPEKLQIIQRSIVGQDYFKFPHSAMMKMHLRGFEQIKSHYKFINLKRVKESQYFMDKPILILGAGPSFQKNIDWVKKNQNHFIIVSVTALMKTLEKEDIVPDILVHVDGFKESMMHLEKVNSMEFFKNTLLLFSSFTYPDFIQAFKKENVYIVQGMEEIKEDTHALSASNVGLFAIAIALYIESKETYLLGIDLALDSKTGSTHASDHVHATKMDIKRRVKIGEIIDYRESIFETAGNFRSTVPVTPYFYEAQQEASTIVSAFKREDIAYII